MKRSLTWLAVGTVALGMTSCGVGPGDTASGNSDGPIKIAYMGILSGPNSVDGTTNALKLAIDQINDAGGIDGRKVEYKSYDTDITPEAAARATQLALRDKPTAIIGYGVSSGLAASIGSIKSAGVPVIHHTLGSITSAKALGYDRVFRLQPTTTQFAVAADKYLFDDLGVKSMVVIHTEDASPAEGASKIMKDASANGVSAVERAVAPTVTDLTEPVLAGRGKDAIWNWGYPTTDALAIKTAAQNGLDVPMMTFSAGTAFAQGLVPNSLATDKILNVSTCGANVRTGAASKKFIADYKAAFGKDPLDSFAGDYDAVYLLKAAIEKAGSTDSGAIADALKTVQLDGACGHLQADQYGNLVTDVAILKWPGGKPALAKIETDLQPDF